MSAIAKYSALFVEGATTNVKAGATFAFLSFWFQLLSALGMVVSQILEVMEMNSSGCSDSDIQKYNEMCMTSFLRNLSSWNGFRIILHFFDAIASFFLMCIGNCLENIFRGSIMSRVLSGTLRLACFMVIFEICYTCGLGMQTSYFFKVLKTRTYYSHIIATYKMMDSSSDMFWTLDNVLYTYFLFILGFLTSEHDKFSKGYSTTAFIGGFCGLLAFICNVFNVAATIAGQFFEFGFYFILQVCLLAIIVWTGKALGGMEGELIGKKGKKGKGKKGKKHDKSKA